MAKCSEKLISSNSTDPKIILLYSVPSLLAHSPVLEKKEREKRERNRNRDIQKERKT